MNTHPTESEVSKIIANLNDVFVDQTEEGSRGIFRPFVFESNGDEYAVKFLGFKLWDSENDEERAEGVSLTEFLMEEANEKIEVISNVRFTI